jgi:DNA-directed RNA polymerase specialized sigma54-like protein
MIALMLKTRGYGVKRRTVANYREGLGIPAARFRKRF